LLSDLKQAMDDLSPDVIFVLLKEGGGKKYVGTARDIMLGADVLLCKSIRSQLSFSRRKGSAYAPRELVAILRNDRRASSIRSRVVQTLDTTSSSSRCQVMSASSP